jgi:hypothetical protein
LAEKSVNKWTLYRVLKSILQIPDDPTREIYPEAILLDSNNSDTPGFQATDDALRHFLLTAVAIL